MKPKMLIATGLIDETNFSQEFPDVEFTEVMSIMEAMSALEENKSTYDYIMISASSFVVTSGLNYDEVMETLGGLLRECKYERFLLMDIQDELKIQFNKYLTDVPRRGRFNLNTPPRLRNFNTLIKKMMIDVQQSAPVEIEEVKVKEKPKEKQKLFDLKMPTRKIPDKKVQAEEPIVINIEEIKKEVVEKDEEVEIIPEPDKKIIKEVKFDSTAFKRSYMLFTSPYRKAGTTTIALLVARNLAKYDMTVCYVQLTERLFTSNIYIDNNRQLDSKVSSPMRNIGKDTELDKLVSVYEDVHFVINSLYDKEKYTEQQISKFISQANRAFDVVIYDIDFELMEKMPSVLNMFTDEVVVLNNNLDCCVEIADKYGELEKNNVYMYNDMITSVNFVINRCSNSKSIEKDGVIAKIVDIDEDLADIEFLKVLGVVEEGNLANNPLDKKNSECVQQILANMR